MHLKFQLQLKNKQNNIMASPITQRVKSYAKQVVIDQDKLKIGGTPGVEDVVTKINKDLGVTFTGEDGGDQYVKDITAERDRRQPNMPLQDYMKLKDRQNAQSGSVGFQGTENGENVDATQWSNQDVEYGNREEEQIIKGSEGKPGVDAYLDPQFKTNLSRSQAANQRRRENMLDRSTKRDNKRNYRLLKKTKRKVGSLTPEQQKQFDYLEKNRFTGGQMNDYNKDSSGNITGNKLQDGSSSLNNPIGWTEQTSGTGKGGQTQATLANIERYKKEYGVEPTIVDGNISFQKQNAKSGYSQKGYSGYQNAPSPKKNKIYGKIGEAIGGIVGKFSKKKKIDFKSTNTKLSKDPKQIGDGRNLPDIKKPKPSSGGGATGGSIGGALKTIGQIGLGATLGYGAAKMLLGSTNKPDNNPNPSPEPSKPKVSYDEAYKNRDRKTYGHMNKSNYIKEAKRQNDVFAKTGKWDYKNAPKDPGPVSSIKPSKVAPVSSGALEVKAPVNLDKISQPERKKPIISNKQEKANNKLERLQGRKVTPRRQNRIAKQQDKAAGLSRGEVRKNKLMRKAGNMPSESQSSISMPRVMTGAQYNQVKKLGNGSAIDAVTSGKVTIQGLEDQLKSASGFRQKGWSGYQK
jgi:hypothetical protein